MLSVECQEHFDKVLEFADKIGMRDNLQKSLDYLGDYSDSPTICKLYEDFAPYSFAFSMIKVVNGEDKLWFNGGLIYHGDHDNGGDGGAPTFSVNISGSNGWSIHT